MEQYHKGQRGDGGQSSQTDLPLPDIFSIYSSRKLKGLKTAQQQTKRGETRTGPVIIT